MLSVDLHGDNLREFGRRFRRYTRKHVGIALEDVKNQWRNEFITQQREFQNEWEPLSDAYAKRKNKEYFRRRINHNIILSRMGDMIDGYIQGVIVDLPSNSVSLQYPAGDVGIRAKAHQGEIGQPKNMPIRPFDLDRFEEIAYRRFQEVYNRFE